MIYRLAVSIATERFIAVRFPLHAAVYLKRRRILLAIVCIYVSALLLNIHFVFQLRVVSVAVCNSNVTSIRMSQARESSEPFLYNFSMYSLGTFIITAQIVPLALLIILNTLLVVSLRKSSVGKDVELRRNVSISSTAQHNERKISMMVIAIIASFVFFNILSAIVWTIQIVSGLRLEMGKKFFFAVDVANILVVTGKSINFIVYCCCSKQFCRRPRSNFAIQATLSATKNIFIRCS